MKKKIIIPIVAIAVVAITGIVLVYGGKGKDTKPSNVKTTSNVNTFSDENEGEIGFTYIPVSTPTTAPTYTPIPISTPVPTNTPVPTPEESGRKILVGDEEYTFIPMSKIMYVIEDTYLYMGPSVKYEMGDHVSIGTKVSVIGELVDYEHWYIILYKGKNQCIWKVSLSDVEPTPTPSVLTWGENGEYTFTEINKLMYATESVNLRQGPSTSYDKTGNVVRGTKVQVVAKCNENDWYMVFYGGAIHFVTSKYISETAPVIATPTPEVTKPAEKPSVTPEAKPTVTPKPTEAPKPTGKITVDNIVTQDGQQGTIYNGVFVPSTTGEYTTVDGKTTLVLDDLDGCNVKIPMPTREERLAWGKKYPDARIIGSGENSIFIPDPGDGGPLGGGSLDLKAN